MSWALNCQIIHMYRMFSCQIRTQESRVNKTQQIFNAPSHLKNHFFHLSLRHLWISIFPHICLNTILPAQIRDHYGQSF